MSQDQQERFETDEYKKKKAAQAKQKKRDSEVALAGLVANASSQRLQSRAGLADLQSMGVDDGGDVENDNADELEKTPIRQSSAKKTSEKKTSATTSAKTPAEADRQRLIDDFGEPPERLRGSRRRKRAEADDDDGGDDEYERPAEEQAVVEQDDNNAKGDKDDDKEYDQQQNSQRAREEGAGAGGDAMSGEDVDQVINPVEVAERYSAQGVYHESNELRGCASNVVPVPLNSKERMVLVQSELSWPTMVQEMTSVEAMWLLDFLENMWCLRNAESIAQARVQQRRRNKRKRNDPVRRHVNDDNDDDDLGDGGGGDGGRSSDDESAAAAAMPQFGPGEFRTTRMLHSLDQVMNKDVALLVRERFNMVNAPYIDTKLVDAYAEGMHAYIAQIGAELLRCRERQVAAARDSLIVVEAVHPHERCEALAAALNGKIPKVDDRIKMLHQHVSNARTNLYSLACLKDPHMPRDLPLELKIMGLTSGDMHTRGKQLEPDYAQQQIQMRLGECQRNRWKRFENSIFEEIIIDQYRTQAYMLKMTIRDWVWHQVDPFTETQEWLQATKTNTVDVVARYLSNATHTTDYLPELRRERTQWSFNNGIYTAEDDQFWEYGKTYPSKHCPFNRDSVSAKLFTLDFPLGLERLQPNQINVTSVTRIFEAQKWPEDVVAWVWALFGRMFYAVGTHDNWQVAPYFKGLAGTGKSTIVEMFQRVYEPTNVGVLSNNMEEKFGLQTHYDKFIVLGPECRQNFRLDQADFQTMISGERMSIARKNMDTMEMKWTAPIMLAGNMYPRWADTGGSVSRRMVPLIFDQPVPESKSAPNLQVEIDKEMPLIIVKANKMYRTMYSEFCKQNIWKVLPPTLKKNRLAMKAETDLIASFLNCCTQEIDPEVSVTVQECVAAFNEWAQREQKIKNPPRYTAAAFKQELVQQNKRCGIITDAEGRIVDVVYDLRLPAVSKLYQQQQQGTGAAFGGGGGGGGYGFSGGGGAASFGGGGRRSSRNNNDDGNDGYGRGGGSGEQGGRGVGAFNNGGSGGGSIQVEQVASNSKRLTRSAASSSTAAKKN